MNFLVISLIIFAYPVQDANGQYYEDDKPPSTWQSNSYSSIVAWRTTDYLNNFTMDVKQSYSSRHNRLRWDINEESYVIWSLNDQLLKYIFPVRSNGTDRMCMIEVTNPFQMGQTANFPVFPDLSNYDLRGQSRPYYMYFREVGWANNHVRCAVWIRQEEQGAIVIQNVTYQEINNRKTIISEYYLFQYGEPDESVWEIPRDIQSVGQQSGTKSGELTPEVMTKKYLMGIGSMWPDEKHFARRMVPQPMLGKDSVRSLRQFSPYQSPFPYSQQECDNYQYPTYLDWTRCGKVSHVKDQNMCSACTTFAAVDALQSAYSINTGYLVDMSVQAVIDCSWNDRNMGCFKGVVEATFEWVIEKRGIPTTQQYGEFKGVNGKCKLPVFDDGSFDLVAPIVSYTKVPPSVNALKMALLRHGPVAVSLTLEEIAKYNPGSIITSTPASNATLAHAGLVVGYGYNQYPLNTGYWIVKNSWGSDWGMQGYFYVGMTDNNPLRLLNEAYYPNMMVRDGVDSPKSYCDICGCQPYRHNMK